MNQIPPEYKSTSCLLYNYEALLTGILQTSPTSGGRSVGIVRSRTKATEFSFRLDS
jgi:hypothetical protein